MSLVTTDGVNAWVCDACGKHQREVFKLITVTTRVEICEECVALCVEIIDSERKRRAVESAPKTTARQREIYTTILEYQRAHGVPPTVRELGDQLCIASTNAVIDHLKALKKKGLVRHRPGRSRGWVAIQPQPQEGTSP